MTRSRRPSNRAFRAPMLLAASLVATLSTGCASGGASTGGSSPDGAAAMVQSTQNIIQTGGANSLGVGSGMTSVVQASTAKVDGSADKVFAALPGVFEGLGIPVTTMVTKDRMLGNLDLKARGRIGSMQMRHLMDCGENMGQPNSDSFQMVLSINSEVKDNGDGTSTVATLVQGTGRSVNFAGSDVRCTTTGELERKLINALKLQLSKTP